jgi:hypothetical protein
MPEAVLTEQGSSALFAANGMRVAQEMHREFQQS